ncbi:MFS general substrate transporter [Glarea lozoyensis ATCC 20868]|uniref:MFS general substrate transporter n=1 Tax=Glarea lozoyensis (strain ATCC 20868 / MF5171) TaxID=1116229 RepID=S3D6Z4_GLAL2|nr:MFS general substrate transporter [Glarea lozoyensis ATCC 20868]EPE33570.1 MFS general substrate transporter [Glarea lozoyensis ATCC 20868]
MNQQHVQELEDINPSRKDADIELNDNELEPGTERLERRVKWKLDLFILPLISLGRTDLGNAKISGMEEELNLSPAAYSLAANCFVIGYILFQLPGTLLLRIIGPQWQFGGAMIMWGMLTAVSVKVTSAAQLQGMRLTIGAAEAFVQGSVFYLSFWYTYRELATRGSIVHACNALAGAFNGLIAYGISKNLEGHNDWHAWRWIFLIEGLIPIGASVLVMAFLPGTPQTVRFGFKKEEIDFAVQRSINSHNDPEGKLEMKKIYLPLMDVHFWLMAVMASAGQFCTSSLSNFLPSIIRGFGYSTVNSQLMTVLVYTCAFVGVLLFARIADRTNARGFTLAVSSSISAIGYALLIGLTNDKARLAATCLVAFGAYPHIVLVLSWMAMSITGYTKRGAAIAMINMISTAFAIAGNTIYSDPPFYKKGNAAALGFEVLCAVSAITTSLYFRRQNVIKRREKYSERANGLRMKTIYEIGDKHPDFFYTS